MKRRDFLKICSVLPLSGCAIARIDRWNVLVRSDIIKNFAQERAILSKASVSWSDDAKIRILVVKGEPYERGYQQGVLLRKEIELNLGYLYRQAQRKFPIPELFDEVYERMRPYIPEEYAEEMRGLAHGARLPLRMIQHIHILPDIGEWGGKKEIVKVVKAMMRDDPTESWGTTCSNFSFCDSATPDRGFYTVRVLDWGMHRISKLHKFPLITINVPNSGVINANIGWVGFLGAVSGLNAEGITLGEMGYGDPPGETLHGIPMIFMLRDVLAKSKKLEDAREIIRKASGTNSYVFLISDGKAEKSEMYVKDKDRFVVFNPGEHVVDPGRKVDLPAIPNILYGGHYQDKMTKVLAEENGKLDPEFVIKHVIPKIAMPSNFQNVIYDARNLKVWISNAPDKRSRAAEGQYTTVDFKKIVETLQ